MTQSKHVAIHYKEMQQVTCFDIETCSLLEAELIQFLPDFEPPKNLVDPVKIAASIEKQKATFFENCALSALTGRILCVGCWTEKKGVFVIESELEAKVGFDSGEADVIQATLDLIQSTIQEGGTVVGFCNKTFDLPFLCQRAWRLGIYVPKCLRSGKWWADEIVDLAELWTGPGSKDRISLDHLAKALGVGAKNGEGKDFGKLWIEDKPKALLYVRNDIDLIRLCADRML